MRDLPPSVSRFCRFGLLAFTCALASCGGGSSPTEPRPPQAPVALEGSWSGTITITSPGSPSSCTVDLTLARQDDLFYIGDWTARCADGAPGGGIVSAARPLSNLVFLTGLLGQPLFGGCGWSSSTTLEGNRLRGDWATPDNCATVQRGRIDLTKR